MVIYDSGLSTFFCVCHGKLNVLNRAMISQVYIVLSNICLIEFITCINI